jgi:hypothetical protein
MKSSSYFVFNHFVLICPNVYSANLHNSLTTFSILVFALPTAPNLSYNRSSLYRIRTNHTSHVIATQQVHWRTNCCITTSYDVCSLRNNFHFWALERVYRAVAITMLWTNPDVIILLFQPLWTRHFALFQFRMNFWNYKSYAVSTSLEYIIKTLVRTSWKVDSPFIRCLHDPSHNSTNTEKTRTYIQAPSETGTHDPCVQETEGNECPKLRGHCDSLCCYLKRKFEHLSSIYKWITLLSVF